MLLREFFETPPSGWQNPEDDHSQLRWGEARKSRLLLKEINKLRRMQEVQAYERAVDLKKIRKQYAPPAAGPGL